MRSGMAVDAAPTLVATPEARRHGRGDVDVVSSVARVALKRHKKQSWTN